VKSRWNHAHSKTFKSGSLVQVMTKTACWIQYTLCMQSNADIINCKVQHRFLRDGSGRKFLHDNIDLYISMVQIRSLIIIPVIKPAMWLATAQDHSLSKLGPVSSRLQAVCPLHASTSSELPSLLTMGCSETPLGHYALLVIKSNLWYFLITRRA